MLAGVYIDAVNEYGQTALYQAAWVGAASVVRVLLAAAADVQVEAHDRTTAAYIAAVEGHKAVVNEFVKAHVVPERASLALALTDSIEAGPLTTVLIETSMDHAVSATILLLLLSVAASLCLCDSLLLLQLLLLAVGCKHTSLLQGAGACIVDQAISPSAVDELLRIHQELPVAPKEKESCSRRSYYCDAERVVCRALAAAVGPDTVVLPQMRFLNYADSGGWLAPHIDLSRLDQNGRRSTHTFLLYLTTCENGGETALLHSVNPEVGEEALAVVKPVAARLLVFPHVCPHEGRVTESVPKVLIRGELLFTSQE